MCRVAAFFPGFPRREALQILLEMENSNTDGVGSAFVKDGKFHVKKWPTSISKIMEDKSTGFLDHMPYNGWTIAHLRAASHGKNTVENTHPFIVDDKWALVHNGIFHEHNLVKLALSKWVKFKGETDTEPAAHLFGIYGPKKFSEEVTTSGVFLGLKSNGGLYVVKTSGQLTSYKNNKNKILIASSLDSRYSGKIEFNNGWFFFDKNGKMIDKKETFAKPFSSSGGFHGGWYGGYDD